MSLIKGIHHISVSCADMAEFETEVAFYRDVLGLPLTRTWSNAKGQNFAMLDTGAGYIEIATGAQNKPGQGDIRHYALHVTSVDECLKAVTAYGSPILEQPRNVVLGDLKARIAFCAGPMGEEIEFFEEF